jgi:tRNA1Val (adenine37-N6)-methyltransferase
MSVFRFKEFEIIQVNSALKVGTDAMVFGAFVNSEGRRNALDIGSGTGVLSLMVAQRNELLKIEAIEIDEGAIQDCHLNFENSKWSKNLILHQGDFLQFQFKKKFDIIFTNPPFYFNGLLSDSNTINLAKHNASLPFDKLFSKVSELLRPNGDFWTIIPNELEENILILAENVGLMVNRKIIVFAKHDRPSRLIFSFSNVEKPIIEESIIIRESSGNYSNQYKSLTQDFHGTKLR